MAKFPQHNFENVEHWIHVSYVCKSHGQLERWKIPIVKLKEFKDGDVKLLKGSKHRSRVVAYTKPDVSLAKVIHKILKYVEKEWSDPKRTIDSKGTILKLSLTDRWGKPLSHGDFYDTSRLPVA